MKIKNFLKFCGFTLEIYKCIETYFNYCDFKYVMQKAEIKKLNK